MAPGNLESRHHVRCESALSNRLTPADLFPAVADCLDVGDVERAVLIHALAGVYAKFDSRRVSDKTAHQAVVVLKMSSLSSVDETKQLSLAAGLRRMGTDKARVADVCGDVRAIGLPDYFPRYMTQHGMGAFMDQPGSELIAGFDPQAVWEETLQGYLLCPAADATSS